MLKPQLPDTTEYLDEFEPPIDWEQVRDLDGNIQEGCYRTLPAPDSDSL
jgi:hypothetical protein